MRIYYGLLPLFVLAMLVTVTTDHLGVLWIALEATTLTTTPLVALYKKDGAIEAAWKYLLLCSLGISVSLLGLLLLAYAGVGAGLPLDRAFSLGALRERAAALDPQVVRWAFVFLFVGIGTKVGFVPMHPWLPDAHSRTPSPISACLSGVLLNVALYALLRAQGGRGPRPRAGRAGRPPSSSGSGCSRSCSPPSSSCTSRTTSGCWRTTASSTWG